MWARVEWGGKGGAPPPSPSLLTFWIASMHRDTPSLSSSDSGSTLSPSRYVVSAWSNSFLKNWRCPLREYPLTNAGASAMQASASFSPSAHAPSLV